MAVGTNPQPAQFCIYKKLFTTVMALNTQSNQHPPSCTAARQPVLAMRGMLIYSAFTGDILRVDPDPFVSLDDFKDWVAQNTSVAKANQLLLSERALQLKLSSIADGQIVILYDKSLISAAAPALPDIAAGAANSTLEVFKLAGTVALKHLQNHLAGLDLSFEKSVEFGVSLERDIAAGGDWRDSLAKLSTVSLQSSGKTLGSLVDQSETDRAARELQAKRQEVKDSLRVLEKKMRSLVEQAEGLQNELEQWPAQGVAEETLKRQQLALVQFLGKISKIQGVSAQVKPQLQQVSKVLSECEDLRAVVARANDMAFLYGAVLIEELRRREWASDYKSKISLLAEQMSGWRNDEIKRRNYWKRRYTNIVNKDISMASSMLTQGDSAVPQFELNLTNYASEPAESQITRTDFEGYLDQLGSDFLEESEELRKMYADLDKVSLSVKPSPFKSGSFQNSQIIMRGSIEDVTRTYESRIKKLESQLHRQITQESTNRERRPSVAEIEVDSLKRQLAESQERARNAEQVKADLIENMVAKESEFNRERTSLLSDLAEAKMQVEALEIKMEKDSSFFEAQKDETAAELDELRKKLGAAQETLVAQRKRHATEIEGCNKQIYDLLDENSRLKNQVEDGRAKVETSTYALEAFQVKARDLSQRLYTGYRRNCDLLECMGLQASKEVVDNKQVLFKVNRVKGIAKKARQASTGSALGALQQSHSNNHVESDSFDESILANGSVTVAGAGGSSAAPASTDSNPSSLYWIAAEAEACEENYQRFVSDIYVDYDIMVDAVKKRFADVYNLAKKYQRDIRQQRERVKRAESDGRLKVSLRNFCVGDLALFLPTKEQREPNPWAAFNVGSPHFFLKQRPELRLGEREWLVARIVKMEVHQVTQDVNPFGLSTGLSWHELEVEES